jgi:hypothetical protein
MTMRVATKSISAQQSIKLEQNRSDRSGELIREGKIIEAFGPTGRGSDPDLAWHPILVPGFPGNTANTVNCP